MLFLKQIINEIKNTLKSKFIWIIGLVLLVACVAIPIVNFITERNYRSNMHYPMPMMDRGMYMGSDIAYKMSYGYGMPYYPGDFEEESMVIDGITIEFDNPFFWYLKNLEMEKEYFENENNAFSSPKVKDLILLAMEEEKQYYLNLAQYITDQMDYRVELVWSGKDNIYNKFIYEHNDLPKEELFEAISNRIGIDHDSFDDIYINISSEDRLRAIDEIDERLEDFYTLAEKDDFSLFIDLRIRMERDSIEKTKEQIAIQEKIAIDDPSQEEWISDYIVQMQNEIDFIEENNIPILEYRLEKNIIPGRDIWQNSALSSIENNKRQLMYVNIVSEEEFNSERYFIDEYKTYNNYLKALEAERDGYNNQIIIAQRSLDANKPDMAFEPSGARNRTFKYLSFASFIAMFATLIGGWLMASEFQQGTIRLLMIRPKTRTKILMAKFLSAFVLSILLYTAGILLNLITNGICFGFKDFTFPNFTISGQVNFWAFYLPKFVVCILPAIFTFSLAFLMSVLARNIAVAIIVPIAVFFGSTILMQILVFSRGVARWIAFTPIPYMDFTSFFSQYSTVKSAIQKGIPLSLGYGIMVMLGLSLLFVIISIITFKKRDITN